jgi:hypothetical protein
MMVRPSVAVGAAAVVVLILTPPANAHVTVAPARVAPGERTLSFTVPNELFAPGRRSSIDAVVVKAPTDVRLGNSEARAGWRTAVAGRTVTWSGGSIPYGQYETFGLEVEVPGGVSQLRFEATERYATPRSHVERYAVLVPVSAPTARPDDSHGLAIASLVIAIAAAVLAAAGFFVALSRWLRSDF